VSPARPRVTSQVAYGRFGASPEAHYRFLAELAADWDRPGDTWVFWFTGEPGGVRVSTAEVN
jgi:hypothetical protein